MSNRSLRTHDSGYDVASDGYSYGQRDYSDIYEDESEQDQSFFSRKAIRIAAAALSCYGLLTIGMTSSGEDDAWDVRGSLLSADGSLQNFTAWDPTELLSGNPIGSFASDIKTWGTSIKEKIHSDKSEGQAAANPDTAKPSADNNEAVIEAAKKLQADGKSPHCPTADTPDDEIVWIGSDKTNLTANLCLQTDFLQIIPIDGISTVIMPMVVNPGYTVKLNVSLAKTFKKYKPPECQAKVITHIDNATQDLLEDVGDLSAAIKAPVKVVGPPNEPATACDEWQPEPNYGHPIE